MWPFLLERKPFSWGNTGRASLTSFYPLVCNICGFSGAQAHKKISKGSPVSWASLGMRFACPLDSGLPFSRITFH